MIQALSRYTAKSEVRDGQVYVIATSTKPPKTSYRVHIARDGDSFERLSSKYLGAPIFYWKIAELNPHVPFPDQIPVGTQIRIPR
jgi:nucleoid-associated protein YgaU